MFAMDSRQMGSSQLLSLVIMALLSLDDLRFAPAGVQEKRREEAGLVCGHTFLNLTSLVSAQMAGLLCEEEVLEVDNVKYCGYCKYHFSKMVSASARREWLSQPWCRGHGLGARLGPAAGRTERKGASSLPLRISSLGEE